MTVFFHQITKLAKAETQELGRAHLHAARLLQCLLDVRPLDILEMVFEIEARRRQSGVPSGALSGRWTAVAQVVTERVRLDTV